MATATVNRLFDSAKIRLPGALDAALLLELFVIAEEFLRETSAWKELIPFVATPGNDPYIIDSAAYTFPLTLPTGTKCESLLGVYDADEKPHVASMPVPGQVILDVLPDADTTLYAYVTLNVKDPAGIDGLSVMPDWVMERHWPALLDGVLSRMMSQMGKPYTSVQAGAYHARRYNGRKAQARVEALRSNVYGAQAWSFPQSFNRRG